MWVKAKETYCGVHGQFFKGLKYALSETVIAAVRESGVTMEKSCAPWDEQKIAREKAAKKSPADKQSRPGKSGFKTK